MTPKKVLFLCIHNSARSQMAEAYLNQLGAGNFIAESAGLEAGKLNPFAVEAMKQDGIDISKNQTNEVNDYLHEGRTYDYVIAVCDGANAARCPFFPGTTERLHWSFEDPSSYSGNEVEKLQFTKGVRDQIKQAVSDFIQTHAS